MGKRPLGCFYEDVWWNCTLLRIVMITAKSSKGLVVRVFYRVGENHTGSHELSTDKGLKRVEREKPWLAKFGYWST